MVLVARPPNKTTCEFGSSYFAKRPSLTLGRPLICVKNKYHKIKCVMRVKLNKTIIVILISQDHHHTCVSVKKRTRGVILVFGGQIVGGGRGASRRVKRVNGCGISDGWSLSFVVAQWTMMMLCCCVVALR